MIPLESQVAKLKSLSLKAREFFEKKKKKFLSKIYFLLIKNLQMRILILL
jgi:hypothetical protein